MAPAAGYYSPSTSIGYMPISNLHGLAAAGVSVWSDQISKQMIDSGGVRLI